MSNLSHMLEPLAPSALGRRTADWARTNGLWWATSITAHALLLSLLTLIVTVAPSKEGDAPVFEAKLDAPVTTAPEIEHFDVGETPIEPTELNTETLSLVDAPQIQQDAQVNSSPDEEFIPAGGGTAANSATAFGGLGGFDVDAIGPGAALRGPGGVGQGVGTSRSPGHGGAGSGFGGRGQGVRKAMLGGFGGTKASERAVAAALAWFARHQNPDGSWSLGKFAANCRSAPCTGAGQSNTDIAATAMALLPYLAAGQTHKTKGPYQGTIYKGLHWLTAQQKADGDLRGGAAMYTHGLASITLCEAFGLSRDPALRPHAQAALMFIESAQNGSTGGWHYAPQGTGDTSVVGWQVMALKSGQMAGLMVHSPVMQGAHKWFDSAKAGKSGGLFCYTPGGGPSDTMTSVGLLCTQYLGAKRDDPAIKEGMAYLMANMPNPGARNCYYWYYATQVMHNLPGPEWDAWNRKMRRVLIDSQIKEGCAAGSWDPQLPTPDSWGSHGGRIMMTSLCCLTLEVYYRYLPLYKLDSDDAAAELEAVPEADEPAEKK